MRASALKIISLEQEEQENCFRLTWQNRKESWINYVQLLSRKDIPE